MFYLHLYCYLCRNPSLKKSNKLFILDLLLVADSTHVFNNGASAYVIGDTMSLSCHIFNQQKDFVYRWSFFGRDEEGSIRNGSHLKQESKKFML